MSMAVALARANELAANAPDEGKPSKEACKPMVLTESIAKKLNIASGEDVGFDLSNKDAWAWHEAMEGVPHVYP